MLKKILIGVVVFLILAVGGIGGYIYMMDWNQHKSVVAERFSQITGLRASIEGDLKVDLLPSPKFSANAVRFFKNNAPRDPLVTVKEISANVDLWPMFSHKFIIKSMTLNNATVNVSINEKGISNWEGINSSTGTQAGDIEVSLNDVRLNDAILNYRNHQTNEEFSLPNIAASVNASSIKGPYKTNGRLIYNNSEIKFQGSIAKNKDYNVNMTFENAPTGTKASINGTLGNQSKGSFSFKSAQFSEVTKVIFGEKALDTKYNSALDLSFQYEYNKTATKLNNFVFKYGNQAAGNGIINLSNEENNKNIAITLDMTQLSLNLLEFIGEDILNYSRQGKKFADSSLSGYNAIIDIKAPHALYNGAEVLNVNMGVTLQQGLLTFTRMGLAMPGNSLINLSGTIDLNDSLKFQATSSFASDDLRLFASIFNIDLAKLANESNKKSIFKRANTDLTLVGDMNHLKIAIPQANVDAITFSGDLGFVKNADGTIVIADIDGSKVLFDKYIQVLPLNHSNLNLRDKFIHQVNLIPWKHDLNIEAKVALKSAVYNGIPLENVVLEFNSLKDSLNVKNLSISNIAGGNLKINFVADNVYTDPYFTEFSYDVKTDNFPLFAASLGIKLSDLNLFSNKLFATQGALSGNFNDLSLSSVQKFGDIEFLYTGTIADALSDVKFDGNLELKSNRFSQFIKALNFDYKPDLPVTSFSLAGKIKGTTKVFEISDLMAYLSANAVKGTLNVDKSKEKPYFNAKLDFDKFDADRFFKLSQKSIFKQSIPQAKEHTFVNQPLFNEEKIDYGLLKNSNFDVNITAKNFIFKGTAYSDTRLAATLKNGVLNVTDFETLGDNLLVSLKFDLDSNVMPKITGSYEAKGIKMPNLVGSVYALQDSVAEASGTFNSLATSPNDFFDNLNSKGEFELVHATMKGWDFALIKFELEQRHNVDGFEDTVLQSLRNGQSNFTRIHGPYEINQGMLVAKKVAWESPVIALNMALDLNISNWLFTAIFNGVYHNASFSDVLKFTFDGNLANPELKVDLSDSIARIGNTEKMISQMKEKQEDAQKSKLKGKIEEMQQIVNSLKQDLSRMELDVVSFKPVTDNKDVNAVYDSNIKVLKESETALDSIASTLRHNPSEAYLREVEADLSTERSKVLYVPKALEDNFVVDSKYVFDATFNKIAWLYNVAQNNSTYYKSLSDIYITQIEPAQNEVSSDSQNNVSALEASVQKVDEDMNKITELHNKVRDNYLVIVDATKVSEMKGHNEMASQALKTLSQYVAEMNQDIIKSFDMFRETLDIKAKDYEQYMVYPPQNPDEIDITQPTVSSDNKKKKEAKGHVDESKEPAKLAPVKIKNEVSKGGAISDERSTEDKQQSPTASDASDDKKKIDSVKETTESTAQPVTEKSSLQPNQKKFLLNDLLQVSNLGIKKISAPAIFSQFSAVKVEKNGEQELVLKEVDALHTDNDISEQQILKKEPDIVEADLVADENILLEDTAVLAPTTTPIVPSLQLVSESNATPSALSHAMQQDIDNNLTITASTLTDTDLSIAKHTQLATEDIALRIEDIKSQAQEMVNEDENIRAINPQKVNPVIAMDMGKNEIIENSLEVVVRRKKMPFKKMEPAIDEPANTDVKANTPQQNTNNMLAHILETKDASPTILSLEDSVSVSNPQTTSKYVFATKENSLYRPVGGTVGKNMLLHKKISSLTQHAPNQYIFPANSSQTNASGLVQKNIKRGQEHYVIRPNIGHQYVFAASSYIPSVHGEVGKNMSLNVK